MLFEPTDLGRYRIFSSITSHTYVDPDGTCRIYYGAPDLPKSNIKDNFHLFGNKTDIRTVELHYHMQPDNTEQRTMYPRLPSLRDFRRSCPIWHFVDGSDNESPKPTINIIITYHGRGELPYDYNTMLNPLLSLMASLTINGFESVVVKIVPGVRGDDSQCDLPSVMSMKVLRQYLENTMGVAKMSYADEECRMKFCPRNLAEWWSWQGQGRESIWAELRADALLRRQWEMKRQLRRPLCC